MHVEPNIIAKLIAESLQELKEHARADQKNFAVLSGIEDKQEDFWQRPGGMRLAGAILYPDKRAIYILFISGHDYFIPINALKNVHAGEVRDVRLDEFEDGVVVEMTGGKATDFSSDFVLYHCEPKYRRQVDTTYHPKPESIARRIGRRVRELRKKKGMSQRGFANAAQMAVANASNLEAGKHEPKLETLQRVAEALGVSIADIVSA